MPTLLLLNGPPASGKSTLARRLIQARPFALNLDVDVVRSQLGGWVELPHEAGLAARRLAVAMSAAHLDAGFDVVVPQFLGRVDFIEELEAVAQAASATFVEVMLSLDRHEAITAFERRTADPQDQTHVDAATLVARSASSDPLGDMYDAVQRIAELRPNTLAVPITSGEVDATYRDLVEAVRNAGVEW